MTRKRREIEQVGVFLKLLSTEENQLHNSKTRWPAAEKALLYSGGFEKLIITQGYTCKVWGGLIECVVCITLITFSSTGRNLFSNIHVIFSGKSGVTANYF